MSCANFQVRKFIERSLHDQMGKTNRGFQWVADHVAEYAISLHAILDAGSHLRLSCGWMEDQGLQLFGFGPEGIEFRRRQLFALATSTDGRVQR